MQYGQLFLMAKQLSWLWVPHILMTKVKDKVWFQTSLVQSFSTYYIVIYMTINMYYFNKSTQNGLEKHNSKPI